MTSRFAKWWWPALLFSSPVLIPFLGVKYVLFKRRRAKAKKLNRTRLATATGVDLPQLERIQLTPLVEWEHNDGFKKAPGVSYFFQTDKGSLLFDLGFGAEDDVLGHNARQLNLTWSQVDALVISHLHMDHMGGVKASRKRSISIPAQLGNPSNIACYLPDKSQAPGFKPIRVTGPTLIEAGFGSSGPLARSLFLMGWCEEQVLVGRLKEKGLVVFTGCGHPGIEIILKMVRQISKEPLYALGGGLHYPITSSRLKKLGMEAVMVFGTGKPPWRRVTDKDLTRGIKAINQANPRHVFLSAHDTCDYAIKRFKQELNASVRVLRAGEVYQL